MDAREIAEEMGQLRFSESLPGFVLDRLAQSATLCQFPSGTRLFREGEQNDFLMIICRGTIALQMHAPRRDDVRILSLGPGDMLAWSALLGNGRMTTSAIVQEDAQVIAVSAAEAESICRSDPQVGYYLMRQLAQALANRLVATRLQLLDLFAESSPTVPLGPD